MPICNHIGSCGHGRTHRTHIHKYIQFFRGGGSLGYMWQCYGAIPGSVLRNFFLYYRMWGVERRPATYKANSLPKTLTPYPDTSTALY